MVKTDGNNIEDLSRVTNTEQNHETGAGLLTRVLSSNGGPASIYTALCGLLSQRMEKKVQNFVACTQAIENFCI
jgi:hypothetical protein